MIWFLQGIMRQRLKCEKIYEYSISYEGYRRTEILLVFGNCKVRTKHFYKPEKIHIGSHSRARFD